jgi:hypothetical protein
MAKSVPVDAPWKARKALEWDSQTAQTWIDENMTDPLAHDFAEQAIALPRRSWPASPARRFTKERPWLTRMYSRNLVDTSREPLDDRAQAR